MELSVSEATLAWTPEQLLALSRSTSMVGNKYRLWTPEDDRRLLELRRAGRSAVSISAALKRSKGSVNARLSILRALAKSPKLREEASRV
jgi:DNA-binding transcriptional MerR regulator